MPRCPLCGYSCPEAVDREVPTTRDPHAVTDSVNSAKPHYSLAWGIPMGTTLKEVEALLITATLQHADGNVKAAAAILGIDRSTLYEKLKRYQIPRP
jgi:DNA-binding NtrC family response regulator